MTSRWQARGQPPRAASRTKVPFPGRVPRCPRTGKRASRSERRGSSRTCQEQSKALDDQLSALKRQEDNQGNSGGGFFQSIGKLVSDVTNDLVRGDASSTFRDVSGDLDAAWNSPRF